MIALTKKSAAGVVVDTKGHPEAFCNGDGLTDATAFVGKSNEGNTFFNSAGFNPSIDSLSRSGRVEALARAYKISYAILLKKHGLSIIGDAAGFNEDPNGESEGSAGTKLKSYSTPLFDVQNFGSRRGGVRVENLYCWSNDGYAAGFACFRILSGLDQFKPKNLNISNFGYALRLDGSEGGLDTADVDINVLNAGCGYYNTGSSGSYYNKFTGCWSDLEWPAFVSDNRLLQGFKFNSMIMTRNNRAVSNPMNKPACFWLTGRNHEINNIHISEAGRNYITGSQTDNCDGLVMDCDYSEVNGGHFISNVTGAAIRIKGRGNIINKPTFRGNRLGGEFTTLAYDATAGYSTNKYDIVVESTALLTELNISYDTRVINSGKCTIVNGLSVNAGDPNSAGDWAGYSKKNGLKILDATANVLWEYSEAYDGGRRNIGSVTATPIVAGGTSGGTFNGPTAPGNGSVLRVEQDGEWKAKGYVRQSDGWGGDDNPSNGYSGTLAYTGTAGAWFEIEFFGSILALVYTQDAPCGDVQVSIDGAVVSAEQFSQNGSKLSQVKRTLSSLPRARHVVRFTNLATGGGQSMTVDSFDIS